MRHSHAAPFAALVVITFLAACHETSDWATSPGAPAMAAAVDRNNDRLPLLLEDMDNPCTEAIESIDLEGVIHGQGSLWDGHFKTHYNVNLTGMDANGVRYVGVSTGNGQGEDVEAPADAVISTLIVSQGGTPNFVSKIVLHFAKDGSVNVEKGGEECRGDGI